MHGCGRELDDTSVFARDASAQTVSAILEVCSRAPTTRPVVQFSPNCMDVTLDGLVGIDDLLALLSQWGTLC